MIVAGIDGGSRTIKVALLETTSGQVIGTALCDQGIDQNRLAEELLGQTLAQHGVARASLAAVLATGYARHLMTFAGRKVTEITCQARGVSHLCPGARSIIEIGGQDSKLVRLEANGTVDDFAMNDRCAAGTGRFLEMMAGRLETSLAGLDGLVRQSREPAVISSMCVVFAETEITGLLSCGVAPAEIVVGVERAVAERVVTMAGRRLVDPVVFTGGVALIPGMRDALGRALDRSVLICPMAQHSGAIGAALIAAGK